MSAQVAGKGAPRGAVARANQTGLDGRRLSLMTPEEVPLVFELAPLPSRALAFCIDLLVVAAAVLIIVIIAIEALKGALTSFDRDRMNVIQAIVVEIKKKGAAAFGP